MNNTNNKIYPFSGMVYCGKCKGKYRHKMRHGISTWLCLTGNTKGASFCNMPSIRTEILEQKSCEVLGLNEFNEAIFKDKIEKIEMNEGNILKFIFKDGKEKSVAWEQISRSSSWNDSMKEKASKTSIDSSDNKYSFSGMVVCGECGSAYRHKTDGNKWVCTNKWNNGISACSSPNVTDKVLKNKVCELLELNEFDEKIFKDKIEKIEIYKDNVLNFIFKNGESKKSSWIVERTTSHSSKKKNKASGEVSDIVVIKDKYGNTFNIVDNTIIDSSIISDKVEIPDEVYYLKAKSINAFDKYKLISLPKNIKSISNFAFSHKLKVSELYYRGDMESFNKISIETYGSYKSLIEYSKHLYVLDENNQYYEAITKDTSMVETKGLDKEILSALLSRNVTVLKEECKRKMNEDSFNTYIRFLNGLPKVIIESKYSLLSDELKNTILNNKVSILADDLIIDYSITKNTKIYYMKGNHKMTPILDKYCDLVIKNDVLVSLKHLEDDYRDKIDLPSSIKKIEEDVFESCDLLLIFYDGKVEDWMKIDIKCDLVKYETCVKCNDGVISYVNVTHYKTKEHLWYGYSHLNNYYKYQARFAISSKNIWEFIKLNHLTIISSHYFTSLHLTTEDDDDNECCILDFHNFKMIGMADVEAG